MCRFGKEPTMFWFVRRDVTYEKGRENWLKRKFTKSSSTSAKRIFLVSLFTSTFKLSLIMSMAVMTVGLLLE